MSQTKAIIADDEAPLRGYLRSRLAQVWPDLILCGEAADGRQAMELIERYRPQVAFLDIRMPGMSGMEVARRISGRCWVVFVTAYDRYALEAFENEAVDYLLKPVTRERLEKTVARLKKRIATASGPPLDLSPVVERLRNALRLEERSGYLNWVRVQQGQTISLIPVDEVCYFKAGDKYTRVISGEGESLIRMPIKQLAEELDPAKFWRIHRSTIVNAAGIAEVSRSMTGRGIVRLKDRPETLAVSRSYIHIFKQL